MEKSNTTNKPYIFINEDDILPIFEKAVNNVLGSHFIRRPENNNSDIMGDLITQEDAMKILGRKTTWFYNMRTTGKLKAIKSANKWWYNKEDIRAFIKNGEQSY
jgi:hypothetical protein